MNTKLLIVGALLLPLSLMGCGKDKDAVNKITINGAGASFPAPLYQRWAYAYGEDYPEYQINYQSVGSGAGVSQFIEGTIDFAASDVAMKDDEIVKVKNGVKLLPMTAGSIVLGYNLPGVDLKLSREVYVDILLGKITKWNDEAIVKLNPSQELPDLEITFVYRSDGSGTTGVFTKHLSAINSEWKEKVGEGKTVNWLTGIGAKGNEGVTAQITQTEGAIGYVEYGYAVQNNIEMATLENKEGTFVKPSIESAKETLSQVELPENLRAFVTDPEGKNSYPIVSYTWMLLYNDGYTAEKEAALESFINWSLTDGQKYSEELGYIPLPSDVVDVVKDKLEE